MATICISSGHGKKISGASGILDEVTEARRVVDALAVELEARGMKVLTFHDNTSTSQSENLDTIISWHNDQQRDYDCSVHFNAYEPCEEGRGVEILYYSQQTFASKLSGAISAASGLINRGAKKNTGLAFLNSTNKPAVLCEICFVDSVTDCEVYQEQFEPIIDAMAFTFTGKEAGDEGDIELPTPEPPPMGDGFRIVGTCSHFGGPDDHGVDEDEGLAFIDDKMDAPHLFLPDGAPGTEDMGLARCLNPFVHYLAVRWDYGKYPKPSLLENVARVTALKTGISLVAFPADWGPHQDTGRIADLSPGLMTDLGITTDDEVCVEYPWRGE